ncbi:MAG: L,D-transpeptidase family protein, partial [Longimicrobiales bacterium]|nr:L,D-transpeptidase family protein [Longimicrobiales bacterium]
MPTMPLLRSLGVALLALPACLSGQTSGSVAPADPSASFEQLLRGRIESIRLGMTVRAGDDRLLARTALPDFYEGRAFASAWTAGPQARARVDELLVSLERGRLHGLDPLDYHFDAVDSLRARVFTGRGTVAERVDLELLASDAFLVFGSHLLHGRVNPETIDPEWLANRRSATLHVVLEEAVSSGQVQERLYGLAPRQPRYATLVDAAVELRALARDGGWPMVPSGPRLELGVVDPRVPTLRERLGLGGDLPSAAVSEPELFDEELDRAVRRFQERHGLESDGVVGPATVTALNVPARERARQIETNLERWRWLPEDLGRRHIEVNIAGFDVQVVEDGRVVRSHRAVVGRQYRETPIFSGSMTYLVLAPFWHVPPTIAAVDKLPLIKADPGVIAAQRMTLLSQATNQPVDPATVDWNAMTGSEFNRRYRLRQDPGPTNALGDVKFMFPNKHNVYLHDTPSRELFQRVSRSFSSGCIRVQDPLALAEYLLADQ